LEHNAQAIPLLGGVPFADGGVVEEVRAVDTNDTGKDKTKKQLPLRLSASLCAELAAWAEAEFRSLNGQIEYLLSECVKGRKKKK
jgi:hypothetical protein